MDERAGHLAHVREVRVELVEFGLVGELAKEQQVRGLLEAGLAFGHEAVDEVGDLDAAIQQPTGCGYEMVARGRRAHDVADACESREYAPAGLIAQPALDVVFDVEPRIDGALLLGDRRPRVEGRVSAARHGQGGPR